MTIAPDGPPIAVETGARATFASRFGALMTMIGVAVGLGSVWRFPYMVGQFGGAAFVLVYLLIVLAIGVPGLMAEWALGRHTRRGPVGAFAAASFPLGRQVGWFFFFIVMAGTSESYRSWGKLIRNYTELRFRVHQLTFVVFGYTSGPARL